MAFFNAPNDQDDHPYRAVDAALALQSAVAELNARRGQDMLTFSIGLNMGEAVVGNIGTPRAMNYTAIGDVVNVASRLQENASENNILLNHETFTRVRQYVHVTRLTPMSVKNKTEPLNVWLLSGVELT